LSTTWNNVRITHRSSLKETQAENGLDVEKKNINHSSKIVGTVLLLIPSTNTGCYSKVMSKEEDDSNSPLSFVDVAKQISSRVGEMSLDEIHVSVCSVPSSVVSENDGEEDFNSRREQVATAALEADVLIGLGLASPLELKFLSTIFRERRLADANNRTTKNKCQFSLDCFKNFAPIVGPYDEANPPSSVMMILLPWTKEAIGRKTMYEMMFLFQMWTVDDFSKALLLFFDRFGDDNDGRGPAARQQQVTESSFGADLPRSEVIKKAMYLPLAATAALIPLGAKGRLAANAMYENAPMRIDDGANNGPTKLPSGVTYEDLRPGTGDVIVTKGKRVNIQWVLKRSNGYYVDSSERNDSIPFIFTVGSSKDPPPGAIAGLDEGIVGMRLGGIRRIIIPPELSYVRGVEDDKPGPVPQGFGPKQRIRRVMELLSDVPGESILLDVKVTRIQ